MLPVNKGAPLLCAHYFGKALLWRAWISTLVLRKSLNCSIVILIFFLINKYGLPCAVCMQSQCFVSFRFLQHSILIPRGILWNNCCCVYFRTFVKKKNKTVLATGVLPRNVDSKEMWDKWIKITFSPPLTVSSLFYCNAPQSWLKPVCLPCNDVYVHRGKHGCQRKTNISAPKQEKGGSIILHP